MQYLCNIYITELKCTLFLKASTFVSSKKSKYKNEKEQKEMVISL